jgi:hypothetical protein
VYPVPPPQSHPNPTPSHPIPSHPIPSAQVRDPIFPHQMLHDYFDLRLRVVDPHRPWGAEVFDARELSQWLVRMHGKLREAGSKPVKEVAHPAAVLLTAPPASGKTCIAQQVVVHTLDLDPEIIPILVQVTDHPHPHAPTRYHPPIPIPPSPHTRAGDHSGACVHSAPVRAFVRDHVRDRVRVRMHSHVREGHRDCT